MYCYKCGEKNKENATFCEECGTKLFPKDEFETKSKIKEDTKEVVKEVGKETVKAVEKVGVETARVATKTAMSTGKKLTIYAGVVALLLAIANYYFTYMVDGPEKVVQTAVAAIEKNDYKTFVSCTDPKFQKQFNIGVDLVGGIINGATGVNIDWNQLLDIQSAFSDEFNALSGAETSECNASNFRVIEVKGEKLSAFVNTFGNKIPSIGNALGSEATIEFEVDNNEKCMMRDTNSNALRVKHQLKVRKYGKEWLIPMSENSKVLDTVSK